MRKVRITQGTYGYKPDGARHVSPKSRRDEPFQLSDAEADRIVGLGIAEYADERVATGYKAGYENEPGNPEGGDPGGEGGGSDVHLDVDALIAMTKAKLEELAADKYVDLSGAKTKKEIAQRIAEASVGANGDDGDAPDLSHEDPVV